MYDLTDTIVAVSSAGGGVRAIVRITGPQAISVCEQVLDLHAGTEIRTGGIRSCSVRVTQALAVDAWLYLFLAPRSYSGEPLAEIHIEAGGVIVQALVQNLLAFGLRPAGAGEFTARAYLNGKLDLIQAEAVNEIISSSNRLQLDAAQKLLGGQLAGAVAEIRADLLDCLSLIEAELDFSGEDIEFISAEQAVQRLTQIQRQLNALLAGSIRCESLLELPAVGIAGAPNAGKSSLLNALLGRQRSIVCEQPKTTRDVLSGLLATDRFQCILFDCAGLIVSPDNVLDELAQRAAVEALQGCTTVIFCVDATKPDWSEDIAVRALIEPHDVIYLATKTDLLSAEALQRALGRLVGAFGAEFRPVSARTGRGLQDLLALVAESAIVDPASSISAIALTARHRQAVTDALENVGQAAAQASQGNHEVTAMLIRAAHQAICEIEQQHVDEQVLDRIFSRFCIGK